VHLLSFTDACDSSHLTTASKVLRTAILDDYHHSREASLADDDSLLIFNAASRGDHAFDAGE
jgi:GntR family transcriptional regulator